MRSVPLDEEDKELFGSYINRTLYDVYRKNVAAFTQMWQEQGISYWLKFCITFRSALQKEGYPGLLVRNTPLPSYSEVFYIQLTKLLIGSNVDNVHEMIRDVVSISRFPQLYDNIPEMLFVNRSPPSPSGARLFFKSPDPKPETKVYCQLPLYLRAVGCLMKLLQRWLTARPLTTKEKLFWKPPQNWQQKKDMQTDIFETYLQAQFGSSLSFLLNVQTADIVWWDEPLSIPKPVAPKVHHTILGEFIDQDCQNGDIELIRPFESMYYHIITSHPRGKILNSKDACLVLFITNISRGLFFVDDLDAFHPYSQAVISFYHSAFGPNFWYGEDGIEKRLRGFYCPDSLKEMAETLKVILNHTVMAQTASSLNSHFYDTLYDGTTWTSAVTLIRLPWNMPLCMNWMEVMLIKIYEFERYLKPLRHFPLKKDLHDILQKLFYITEEAAFFAKAAIILAENIHQNQDCQASMSYSLRKLLPDVIKKLANVMQFLEKNAYKILNVILKNGWSIEEQEIGENHSNSCSRVLVSLSAVNSLPDVDQYFAKNFRSIYNLLGNEMPDIENGGKYAVEVVKLIQNFKSESSRENNKKSDYDFAAFKKCVQGMSRIPGGEPQVLIIDLLVEDGWIFKAEENVPHNSLLNNAMQGLLSTQNFKHFSAAYFIAAYFVGDFRDCNISGQNALARLHRAECLAIMSDSGLKLSSMVQKQASIQPIPPPRFFKGAFREIHNRCADTDLTVEDATKLLQMVEQVKSTNLNTPYEESLTDVCVPTEVELIDPAVRLRWLECFEKKRVQLLQLVSEEQFKITQACQENKNAASRCCFPLNEVLEFRLVEEAAALRKTLEMNLKPIGVHNLVKLLAYRLNWLQNAYCAWKKEKNSWKLGNRPQQFTQEQMRKIASKNFIGMLVAKLHFHAMFNTLISEYGTTHPVCEITLRQMSDEAVILLGISALAVGPRYWDYCDSVSKAGAYCEQFILHCKEVWNVPLFNCEPQMEVHFGSAGHAEWIVTVFQKFYLLVFWKTILPPKKSILPKVLGTLTETMIAAMALMTVLVVYPQEHLERITKLKATFKHIWFHLLDIKKDLKFTENIIMEFLGDKHSKWIELLKLFCSNKHSNVLVNIAFSEFINASESEWNRVIKQKKQMEKEAKVRNTEHQECQITAKEKKMIMISDDKDKYPMHQEHKNTINEKMDEKDKPVLQESEVTVREEKLIAISDEKGKEPVHQETSNIKEEEVIIISDGNSMHSDEKDKEPVHLETNNIKEEEVIEISDGNNVQTLQVKSKDLDEGACQQASVITVEDKSESSANKKKVQVNKGSSSRLKVCNFCKKVEKKQGTFKKCSLCKKEKWENGHFFCSEECEANDWIEMHRAVHKPE